MKRNRKIIMFVSIVIMLALWAVIAIEKGTELLQGLGLPIFILVVILGVILLINTNKKEKNIEQGLPVEDEMSNLIKYKSGYFAYLYSMYMWLIIFVLKDKFPDNATMIGGGILLSAVIFGITKYVIKNKI